ncbi:MAG: LapA family protein [Pseudomonadota bacterium]
MKHLRFILAILLMLVIVILIVENHEAMSTTVVFKINLFSLIYQSSSISLYYIVTIAFLFGILISGLYGILERFRLKRRIRVIGRELQDKDQELNSLRNLPITSGDMGSDQKDSPS